MKRRKTEELFKHKSNFMAYVVALLSYIKQEMKIKENFVREIYYSL